MNTNAIIGVVVAVVVIGGGALYFTMHPAGAPGTAGTEGTVSGDSGTGTFAALMALGGSKKCEVTVTTPESPATGTVYVSGGSVRSDIVAKPANMGGKEVGAHMIKSGDYIYSWTDMVAQGVKIKMDAAAQGSSKSAGGYDANAQVQYSCSAWIPDASMFEVPSSVTFMEFSGGAAGGTYPAGSGMTPPGTGAAY